MKHNNNSIKQFIITRLKRYLKFEVAAFILTLVLSIISLAPPKLIGKAVNHLTNSHYRDSLTIIMISIGLILFTTAINYILRLIFIKMNNSIILDLRNDIFKSVINNDTVAFNNVDSGKINNKFLNDVQNISSLFGQDTISIVIDIIKVGVVVTMLFFINIRLTVYSFLNLVPLVILMRILYPMIKKKSEALQKKRDKVFGAIYHYLKGIKTIKFLAIEDTILVTLKKSFIELKNKTESISILSARSNSSTVFFQVYMLVIIWVIGGYELAKGRLTIGELITIEIYLNMLFTPMKKLLSLNVIFSRGMVSIRRIMELISNNGNGDDQNTNEIANTSISGDIVITGLTFNYEGRRIFNTIDLHIQPNSLNAVVGKSGIGKSTMALLFAGVLTPEKGVIKIGGRDTAHIPKQLLRKNIGYVESEPILFGNTVQQALMLPEDGSLDEEAIRLLKHFCLDDMAQALEMDQPFIIGIDACQISHGQTIRIALIRMLLKRPRIMIIDEGLSAQDILVESLIIDVLKQYKDTMTIILITHSLNFIDAMDTVILLQKNTAGYTQPIVFSHPQRSLIINHILQSDSADKIPVIAGSV